MRYSPTTRRLAALGGVLIVTTLSVAGCSPSIFPAPVDDTGWAILSPTAQDGLRLDIEGGFELDSDVLALDGVTGFGSVAAPDDFDATRSFTVAAWASPTADTAPFASVVSQLGETAAGFFLGYAEGMPAFSMKDADTNDPGHTIRAAGTDPLVSDEWVHLAGVFDADEGEIALYVDGALIAQTAFDAPWRPTGVLTVGRSQAHGVRADFWGGAITEVRIIPTAASADDVSSLRDQSRPAEPPLQLTAADPSTYADGVLDGTWDSALSPEEVAFVTSGFTAAEKAEAGEITALRLGFSGPRWWQGFVAGDELWLVGGVPEGDGGLFSMDESTLTTGTSPAQTTLEWSLDGDVLTLVLLDCRLDGVTCPDIDMVRFMNERVWTASSADPSY